MFYPEMVRVMHLVKEALIGTDPRLADMLSITCQKTKICEYRGAEPTGNGACPFSWAGKRRWLPELDAQRPDMKGDVLHSDWGASGHGDKAYATPGDDISIDINEDHESSNFREDADEWRR